MTPSITACVCACAKFIGPYRKWARSVFSTTARTTWLPQEARYSVYGKEINPTMGETTGMVSLFQPEDGVPGEPLSRRWTSRLSWNLIASPAQEHKLYMDFVRSILDDPGGCMGQRMARKAGCTRQRTRCHQSSGGIRARNWRGASPAGNRTTDFGTTRSGASWSMASASNVILQPGDTTET